MRVQHNIPATNAYRNYSANTKAISKNLEKLSSGYRINRAGDDAAGLAISEKMRAQITGLNVAQKNAKDGISLVQTAEGALTEVHSMLNRMFSLSEQSANGTYDNAVDRANLQKEFGALRTEIDRIADSSNFNGKKLLDGSLSNAAKADMQIGTTVLSAGAGAGWGIGTMTLAADDGATKGIAVTITPNSTANSNTLAIALGTDGAANTYSTAEIEQAVRTAAQSYMDANKATLDTNPTQKAQVTSLLSFTMSGEDIHFAADAAAADYTTGAVAPVVSGANSGLSLQIGDTADTFNKLTVSVGDMHAAALGLGSIDIGTQDGASSAMASIKTAINSVSGTRGDLGALQNRLDHTINNLGVMEENIQDAESTVRDTDVAQEMMSYTKNNILVQSAQAMLAQANQLPQGVLQLLQ